MTGNFSIMQMVHTMGDQGPLPGVRAWSGSRRVGELYRYRSIPCTGAAPVNNLASNLPSYDTRIRNSRSPASMRAHPFTFRIVRTRRGPQMRGTITFTVCKLAPGPTPNPDPVPDAQKPKIRVRFAARFIRRTPEEIAWWGTFRLAGGTQRYEDMSGSGEISGYFFCFAQQGCAANGGLYRDAQFTMQGRYRDPTPRLAAG